MIISAQMLLILDTHRHEEGKNNILAYRLKAILTHLTFKFLNEWWIFVDKMLGRNIFHHIERKVGYQASTLIFIHLIVIGFIPEGYAQLTRAMFLCKKKFRAFFNKCDTYSVSTVSQIHLQMGWLRWLCKPLGKESVR